MALFRKPLKSNRSARKVMTNPVPPVVQQEESCSCHAINKHNAIDAPLVYPPRTVAVNGNRSVVVAPTITSVKSLNIYETYMEFEYDGDDSQVEFFYVGVSKTPGNTDLFYGVMRNYQRSTKRLSNNELGLTSLINRVYFTIWAKDLNGNFSAAVTSNAIFIRPNRLGQPFYNFNFQFSPTGFDADGNTIDGFLSPPTNIQTFVNRVIPIIRDVIGHPAKNDTLTFVKDARYLGTNIYIPDEHAVYSSFTSFNPRLLVHELVHAWKGKNILAADENWNYNPTLSGFEESMAEGIAYIVMNKYHLDFPNDTIASPQIYDSINGHDYEWRNLYQLITEDFWSDSGGMGLALERYYTGSAAIIKMWIEDPNVFKKFYRFYYLFLNRNRLVTPTRELVINIFDKVMGDVEGEDIRDWIDKQRIFDCEIQTGNKVFNKRLDRLYTEEYAVFNEFYYYETFDTGSDWFKANDMGGFDFYNKNGSIGEIKIKNLSTGVFVWEQDVQIQPILNPPVLYQYGSVRLHITSINVNDSYISTLTSPNTYNVQVAEKGLYEIFVSFDNHTESYYQVLGHHLANFKGVYGCVKDLKRGFVKFSHSEVEGEVILPIQDHVFSGATDFTAIDDFVLNTVNSVPGVVTIELLNNFQQSMGSCKRNINYGDETGSQFFFFERSNFADSGLNIE